MSTTRSQGRPGCPVGSRLSILTYLILMSLILLGLLFPSISIWFYLEAEKFRDAELHRHIEQMRRSLESRSASLARSLALSAGQSIAGYDFTNLDIMVRQVVAEDPEMLYGVVMDTNRQVVVHTNPGKIGAVLSSTFDHRVARLMAAEFPPSLQEAREKARVRFIDGPLRGPDEDTPQILEAIAPIYSGNRLWGVLRCGFSLENLREEIRTAQRNWQTKMDQFKGHFVSITLIFFSVGVLIATLFTRSLVRSVSLLTTGVNRVSRGDLEHEIAQKGLVCSEIMRLSDAFNEMTAKLKTSHQKLDDYNRSLEQKVEERTRDLREAQTNMLQQAHEAGMAEMAVGILHNIGNAITPAKVGTSLLLKRLRNSPLRTKLHGSLQKIDYAVNSNVMITDNERQQMSQILQLLPESIKEEYDQAILEIENLRNKYDHIESIIGVQMRYARSLFGDAEEVNINEVVEDALRILDDSLQKREIEVVKHYAEVPQVRIEKAKLIQIIVNLIKNGYEAIDGGDPPVRKLVLTTCYEKDDPGQVVFKIRDTGMGFSAETGDNLFVFGFTTKEKGAGFGLHSSANYLIANNGLITACSDGPGQGAEFTVRLALNLEKGSAAAPESQKETSAQVRELESRKAE